MHVAAQRLCTGQKFIDKGIEFLQCIEQMNHPSGNRFKRCTGMKQHILFDAATARIIQHGIVGIVQREGIDVASDRFGMRLQQCKMRTVAAFEARGQSAIIS